MKLLFATVVVAQLALAQYVSPPAETSVSIGGKKISIAYHAPQKHGRTIFGGLVPYGEVWRAGANDATALHTDADLQIKTLRVPKGDYTLFILPRANSWQLIVNKQTGQWGLEYHPDRDLGRVPMDLTQSPSLVDAWKMTLSAAGGNKGLLRTEWDKTIASVAFTVQ